MSGRGFVHGEHISRNYKRFAYHGSKSAVQRRGNATCPLEIPACVFAGRRVRQPVRPNRDHLQLPVPSRRPRKRRRRRASPGKSIRALRSPSGRRGGTAHRRAGPERRDHRARTLVGVGLYRQSRSDGKGVCAQSPQFPLRRARVPHGRQRDADGRRRSGLLRSQRQSDQVPRAPNRAGRDRQGVRRVLRRRQVPMRLRFQKEPAMRVLRRNGLRERASRSGGIIASRFHEADAHREGAEHAAEQEREGGPCDAPESHGEPAKRERADR